MRYVHRQVVGSLSWINVSMKNVLMETLYNVASPTMRRQLGTVNDALLFSISPQGGLPAHIVQGGKGGASGHLCVRTEAPTIVFRLSSQRMTGRTSNSHMHVVDFERKSYNMKLACAVQYAPPVSLVGYDNLQPTNCSLCKRNTCHPGTVGAKGMVIKLNEN